MANKDHRTPEQRERDFVRATQMRLRGLKQHQIAKQLGVSQQQVSYDLKKARREWAKERDTLTDDLIAEDLARLDEIYAQCWQSFQASIETKQVTDDNGNKHRIPVSGGDPRHLANALRCEEKRIELLGIKPPQKVAPTTPDGKEQYSGVLVVPGMQSAEEWLASSDNSTEPDPA